MTLYKLEEFFEPENIVGLIETLQSSNELDVVHVHIINHRGGALNYPALLLKAITNSKATVKLLVSGFAASASCILVIELYRLALSNPRILLTFKSKDTFLMFHAPFSENEGKVEHWENIEDGELKRGAFKMDELCAETFVKFMLINKDFNYARNPNGSYAPLTQEEAFDLYRNKVDVYFRLKKDSRLIFF